MRVVFIHGAFSRDGAWWWAPTADHLERSGITSTAVALPSCGEDGTAPTGTGPGLEDDAAATAAVLDEGGPTILVAHSYGGMVAAQAGTHPAVRALLYISSFLPAVGEDLASVTAGPDPVPVIPHADGSVSVDDRDVEAFDARFLHDIDDPALVRGAHDRLCPQSAAVFGTPVTAAAWQHVPSTYLVCAEERSTPPDLQRAHASRAGTVHELPAGHFPFLSRPDLVAAHVEQVAREGQAQRPG
jgi:pimeloyl-ACP methyl ester carboxylesterase